MQDTERKTIDVWPDAAKALGLGKNQAYAAARSGQIPCIRVGKRLLVLKDAFDRMLKVGNA